MRNRVIGLGFAAVLLAWAASADATIYNISATNTAGTVVTLGPGSYNLTWVGTAQGGAYNGANGSCSTGDCSSGWSEAFVATSPTLDIANHYDADLYTTGTTYSSALVALAAYQGGATVNHLNGDAPLGSIPTFSLENTFTGAYSFSLAQGNTYHLFFLDPDQNPANNFGGVSLSITPVPEPSSWALMIMGTLAIGALMRRKWRSALG